MIPLGDIRAAAARLAGRVHRTPLLSSSQLGERAGVRAWLKCESFQKTGSFKARGALNKVLSLSDAERARGLVTVSAGNHAAAVAWAARAAGCVAVVVMPTDAPRSKIEAVEGYGAEIVFHADRPTLFDKLHEVRIARGLTFVHPFDDPIVLAGAGTAGLEIAEDLPGVGLVVVPVGGGGLLGGVASAIRQARPGARIVAVELEAGPGLGPALAAGKPVPVPRPSTLADGMTPPFVGALAVEIAREAVDEIVTVTEAEIIEGMRFLMTRAKLYVEGSGAAATAALLAGKVRVPAGTAVAILVSGGNVDLEKLAVLARA
ncbi:MAG TPA: pyridoxal-phosphate dependent enzyme [Thermoanaerobaculia bacterium]|jgi:threonine dehydratase|nr:pyridoxal-phosphate dependent enzyme [Thermoanaerobaculia bacterium]